VVFQEGITGEEREDLKNQISKLDILEVMSVIIRTAGIDRFLKNSKRPQLSYFFMG
jgi:hypothetical protein